MTSRAKQSRLARAGIPLGLGLAALAVSGWMVPAGNSPSGMAVTVTAAPTGELGVAPSGIVAKARDMRPGDAVDAQFAVTNQTGRAMAVSLRAAPQAADLDAPLHVSTTFGDRAVADGPLSAARNWSRRTVLAPGEQRPVRIRLSVPPGASGYEYRQADTRIELRSEPAR